MRARRSVSDLPFSSVSAHLLSGHFLEKNAALLSCRVILIPAVCVRALGLNRGVVAEGSGRCEYHDRSAVRRTARGTSWGEERWADGRHRISPRRYQTSPGRVGSPEFDARHHCLSLKRTRNRAHRRRFSRCARRVYHRRSPQGELPNVANESPPHHSAGGEFCLTL